MSFITELWESVFTPGTTPALITATHVSFILLIILLAFSAFVTGSIHFINLLVIAILLYASVIWFVNELKQAKLKDNEEVEKESESTTTATASTTGSTKGSTTGSTDKPTSPKKRKV